MEQNSKPLQLLAQSIRSIADGRFLTGDAIGGDYGHDELPGGAHFAPEAVCVVETTEEVSAVLAACNEHGIPVTVRGAGTGKVGGSVPIKGGVVLSMAKMNGILGFNEAEKTLTVQPGVLLQDIKAEASNRGLVYPPDPGEATATVGGNVATDAGGPCALKYGSTRDYVADAVVVLADGTVARLSEKPELCAVIGSEGTLGVITEITLKLVEKPAKDVILLFPFMDAETCISAAAKIQAADFAPAILEYLDTDLVEFSGKVTGSPVFPVEMDGERVGATLMLTLEAGTDDELDEQMEAVAELAEELECLDILVVDTPTLKRDVWAAHDAFHSSLEAGAKSDDEVNITLPVEAVAEFIDFAKALGEEKGLKVMIYAHAGSGGVHVHAVSEAARPEFAPLFKVFADALYAKCGELGGDIAGEYGIGYAKREYLNAAAKAELAAAKTFLDPCGILNPGKVF